jgi:hypothetical protein
MSDILARPDGVGVSDQQLQQRADTLATLVEALAGALHAGGVPAETSTSLLARASAVVLQALNLELLTSERPIVPDEQAPEPLPSEASFCVVFDAPSRSFKAAA